MKDDRQIKIFDTTLRDGQQCPGAGMSFEKNLEYARLTAKLGIDVLEAGFPAASKLDFEIVKTIAEELAPKENSPIITALCQLREAQVEATISALEPATKYNKSRLHVYVPVDPKLMEASLGSKAEDHQGIIRDLESFVKLACTAGLEIEFSPEGYSRMCENFDYVTDLIRAAITGGATIINCPDTIGGACWLEGEEYFVNKMNRHAELIASEFPGRTITWSTHCHNDFGMALQNSLNAVFYGPATQIEGCINGIGERAGNVSLEQCIVGIKHFGKLHDAENPYFTKIKTEYLQEASDFVSSYMLKRQSHSPICGDNAAKHSSGGHTNAVLKNPLVYQPFDPKEVGKEITLLFGPLSGGNHAKSIIENHGYVCADSEKAEVAQFIKDVYSERRKGVTDEELMQAYVSYRGPISVTSFDYSRSANRSSLIIEGKFFDQTGKIEETCEGKDSALAALKIAVDKRMPGTTIESYRSESRGTGIEAESVSTILLKDAEGVIFEGIGVDSDIEISAMKALINSVNKAYVEKNWKRKQ